MLNDPLSRVIPQMAIPTIISFLINSIYSLADTVFVSSLGTNATAAVSVNASLDQLIMMCGSMLAMGANSYIARLLGEEVTALSFAGGHNGDFLTQGLEQTGIRSNFVSVPGETRCCINIRDQRTGSHTEFLEPGQPVTEDDLAALLASFDAHLPQTKVVTISGSTPKGTPVSLMSDQYAEGRRFPEGPSHHRGSSPGSDPGAWGRWHRR